MGDFFAIRADFITGDGIPLTPNIGHPASGDACVLYDPETEAFTGSCFVRSVETWREPDADESRMLVLRDMQRFDTARKLAVFAGTLHIVRNPFAPQRHFRRRIVGLWRRDYHAIVRNTPDVDRSVFRFLFHALPRVAQVEFIRTGILNGSLTPGAEVTSYASLNVEMLEFLDRRMMEPFNLMKSIVSVQQGLPATVPALTDLRFTDEDRVRAVLVGQTCADVVRLLRENVVFSFDDSENLLPFLRSGIRYSSEEHEPWHETIS